MQKKVALTFYKALLYSDYHLIKQSLLKQRLDQTNCYIRWTLEQKYAYLNLLEILKELKQLVRVFQFFNAKDQARTLFLLVPNVEEHLFIQNFFTEFFIKDDNSEIIIKLKTIFKNSEMKKKVMLKLFCLLGSHSENQSINMSLAVLEKIYLYITCNLIENTRLYHEYRVYNDFLDFQKIIFLLILINKVQSLKFLKTNKTE